jgi:hypothetical protein
MPTGIETPNNCQLNIEIVALLTHHGIASAIWIVEALLSSQIEVNNFFSQHVIIPCSDQVDI